MDPTRSLREEHQVILAVLDCFALALDRARREQRIQQDVFNQFVSFFRGFADKCHHCKEEDRLFPCLERCGMPRDEGPLQVMMDEHKRGRAHVVAIALALPAAAAGDAGALRTVLTEGTQYVDMLRHHIMKEDHVLFNMADELVQGPARVQLTNQYAEAEGSTEYAATLAATYDIAMELCRHYGVTPPTRTD